MARNLDKRALEVALKYAALVVAEHGEMYLPIFLKVESDLAALELNEGAVDRARRIALAAA